jgi:cytochrome c5
MKFLSLVCISAVIIFGCSPKITPTASTTPPVTETTKAPDEIKVAPVDPKNSAESIAGSKTYEAKCGRCHGLKKVDDFTAEQWVPILKSMAPKAKLDSTENANVLVYVQTHAKGA